MSFRGALPVDPTSPTELDRSDALPSHSTDHAEPPRRHGRRWGRTNSNDRGGQVTFKLEQKRASRDTGISTGRRCFRLGASSSSQIGSIGLCRISAEQSSWIEWRGVFIAPRTAVAQCWQRRQSASTSPSSASSRSSNPFPASQNHRSTHKVDGFFVFLAPRAVQRPTEMRTVSRIGT